VYILSAGRAGRAERFSVPEVGLCEHRQIYHLVRSAATIMSQLTHHDLSNLNSMIMTSMNSMTVGSQQHYKELSW